MVTACGDGGVNGNGDAIENCSTGYKNLILVKMQSIL